MFQTKAVEKIWLMFYLHYTLSAALTVFEKRNRQEWLRDAHISLFVYSTINNGFAKTRDNQTSL
jgi:hypothetical protein